MAQRISGPYSPGTRAAAAALAPPRRVSPVGARVNLLFVLPFAFAIRGFFRDPVGLAADLAVFALLVAAAWMTREGVIAQDAYDQRKIARRPGLPRKAFGAVLTGLGLGLAGVMGSGGIVAGAIFGVLGVALHLVAFGPDPMRDKGLEGVDLFQAERVNRAVTEAESHLDAMQDAIKRARDPRAETRLGEFQTHVRALLRAVQDNPAQLTAARRYMGVYLLGAREATVKYADLYTRTRDPRAQADYLALLDDLQGNFALRTESLLDSDRTALDIEMAVLRERLEREGLRPRLDHSPQMPADPTASPEASKGPTHA
jgi:hypothetical protein